LPAELHQPTNTGLLASLSNPRILLSAPAMAELQKTLGGIGPQGTILFMQTIQAVRASLETGLRTIFLIGAITMLVSFLLILTIPEIKLDGKEPS